MYSPMLKLINSTDSRYLTQAEQAQVLDYTNSIPKRFEASRAIEQHEAAVVSQTVDLIFERYPNYASLHDNAKAKSVRDMQLVLRYAVQGMLLDDLTVGPEKLYIWLRRILSSYSMTPKFITDSYTILKDEFRRVLPADAFKLMEQHFAKIVEVLGDFPEPAIPAV